MNNYTWDTDLKELVITEVETKSMADIEEVLLLGKDVVVIDNFIALHLLSIDPAQLAAHTWYENELELLASDPKQPRAEILDANGVVTGTEPNAHDIALSTRNTLEYTNKWLKGLRGLKAPKRPTHALTISEWRAINIGVQLFKRDREQKVKDLKVNVGGVVLDGDETSQNRLARAGLGMLAAKLFAIESVLRTSTTTSARTLRKQLVAALDSPEVSINTPWVASDNSVTSLNSKTAIEALVKAGTAQSAVWNANF